MDNSFLFVWLAIGGSLRLFDFGRKTIPVAAWLSPIFLLHFAHGFDPFTGTLLIWFAIFLAAYFAYREVIPVPGIAYPLTVAVISLTLVLPYLADRLLYTRFPGFISVLIFPLAWVVVEFVTARTSPFSTWGSVAYTQYGNKPFMQLASVTGLWGMSFLITWFSSTINWAWEHQFNWDIVQTGFLIYVLVWLIVMLAGGARLVLSESTKTVRVATISWPENILGRDTFMRIFGSRPLTEGERRDFQKAFGDLQNYFLDESRREAQAGAGIIVWPEANLLVFKSDESVFIERAEQLSHEENVYLLMGMGTIVEGSPTRLENKSVLVHPVHGVAYSYLKKNPVPGWEAQVSIKSDGQLHANDSEYGRLSSAVCFDMDFPYFIRQVGRLGTDILLVPASDWEPIKYLHHVMAVFRAVENGTALVRATRWGLSAAVDAFGRTLAITDGFSSTHAAMVAQVPMQGVRTLYARMGDWFAWICVVGLLGFMTWSVLNVF